ncbi:MAG: DUF1501 domain-containing protein [Planctomycetaceae bacterium]
MLPLVTRTTPDVASAALRPIGRRTLLRLGTLGGFGISLPQFLRAETADRTSSSSSFGRAKRCLLVFLNGGPSQVDLWDMKPHAPAEVRGELRPIATNVPGVEISELLPLTAQQADKFKIVRSVTHPCSVHTTGVYTMLTGVVHQTPSVDQTESLPTDRPHLGSIVAKWRGWRDGLPPFVTLPTLFRAPPVTGIWAGQNAGFLGRRYDPLVVEGNKQSASFALPSIEIPRSTSWRRLDDRRALLTQLDRPFRVSDDVDAADGWDDFSKQAYSLLQSRRVRQAMDLNEEPEAVRDRYGRHLFGQGLLMARRLIEADVPLVTIYWIDPTPAGAGGGEYDSHGRIYYHMRERLVPPTDRGLSTLFADLSDRGLLDDTLIVVMGEFGRTPRINADAGRDHWPQVQSILMAGAGIAGGSVYGSSDRFGGEVAAHPVTPSDLTQSIFHRLGVPPSFEIVDLEGRTVRACDGEPVRGLLSG